jgi:hypothetical protein
MGIEKAQNGRLTNYSCKCLNIRITEVTSAEGINPYSIVDPNFIPTFVGEGGIVVVRDLFAIGKSL